MFRLVSNRRGLAAVLDRSRRAGRLPEGFRWASRPEADALELRPEGPAAEQLAAELEHSEGRRYWYRGRWWTERKQLRLPGVW